MPEKELVHLSLTPEEIDLILKLILAQKVQDYPPKMWALRYYLENTQKKKEAKG